MIKREAVLTRPANSMYRLLMLILPLCVIFCACTTGRMPLKKAYREYNAAERAAFDSLLLYGLDHEALYTLCDTLKPVSSIKSFRLPLLSAVKKQQDSARAALAALQLLLSKTNSGGDIEWVLSPFERPDSIYKITELYAVRKSRLQHIIRKHEEFYSSLGITAHTPAATVLAITEHSFKYTRWRSYGYLFGYPDHAVDFFVEAGREQDSTGIFVKRDFFQVPVYTGPAGYFTYAVPKGYIPAAEDSAIYKKAINTVERYRKLRKKAVTSRGFKAELLFRKMHAAL